MCDKQLETLEQAIFEADKDFIKEVFSRLNSNEEKIRLFMRNFIKKNSPEFRLVESPRPISRFEEPEVIILGIDDDSE